MLVYLAGSIWGLSEDAAGDWRTQVEETIGKERCLNPMRHEFIGSQHEHLHEIITLDKMDIRRADVLLVYHTRPSVGTSMEVFYAWTLGKPIVVVNKSMEDRVPPWLEYHATVIFEWTSDAIKWIGDHIA